MYDGEMFGIWKGIEEGLKRVRGGEGVAITIRSDNQQAVKDINTKRSGSSSDIAKKAAKTIKKARSIGAQIRIE